MSRLLALVVAFLFSSVALAQTSAGAQVGASASQDSSVSTGQSGAQVQSNTSANADVSAQASREHRDRKRAGERGDRESGAATAGGQLASGTTINAALVKPVDARKNKPGDMVMAKTTQDVKADGRVVIPKGSRIVGHVTQAGTRAKGESQSSLGLVFDRAILKDGGEVPLNTSIQAIAAAQSTTNAFAGDDMASMSSMGSGAVSGGARSGGGLLGGVGSAAGASAGTLTSATANAGGALNSATSVTGALNSTSSGVVGLPGMRLNSATSAAAQGSVITSAGKNIHLDSGTQMLLQVTGSASRN
jgi:hypothetical protein